MEHLSQKASKVVCMEEDIAGLTTEQLHALHVFKFDVLASLHRVYMVVPEDVSNPLIKKQISEIFGGG